MGIPYEAEFICQNFTVLILKTIPNNMQIS